MPTPPSYVDQYNFISFWWANPCDFGLQVYFETGFEALGRLAWVLVGFDTADLIRSYMRPGGTRSARHGRKGRRGGKRGGGLPEISDMIATQLPGHEFQPTRQVSDGVRNLWDLDSWGQKWAYRLMVVDLVANFWYDWNSAIMMHPESRCPTGERGCRRNTSHVIAPGGWGQMLVNEIVYMENGCTMGVGSVSLGPFNYRVIASCKARLYGSHSNIANVQIGLASGFSSLDFLDVSSREPIGGFLEKSFISSCSARGPGGVNWRVYVDGDFVELFEVQVIVAQVSDS